MTATPARAGLDELDALLAAATVAGVLSDEEHRARLEAEWALLHKAAPAMLAAIRAAYALAEDMESYPAKRNEGAGFVRSAEWLREVLDEALAGVL